MIKLFHFIDNKHFGNQVLVYKGKNTNEEIYLLVIKDREEIVYYFVDKKLEHMYPINSYIDSLGITIDLNNVPEKINVNFHFDLSNYGCFKLPMYFYELLYQFTDKSNMTYSKLQELIQKETTVSKKIYMNDFFFCNSEKMRHAQITIIKNIIGKYVVTLWKDYEYGKYELCKSFTNKDDAATFAWDLFRKNNPVFCI